MKDKDLFLAILVMDAYHRRYGTSGFSYSV